MIRWQREGKSVNSEPENDDESPTVFLFSIFRKPSSILDPAQPFSLLLDHCLVISRTSSTNLFVHFLFSGDDIALALLEEAKRYDGGGFLKIIANFVQYRLII